MSGMTVPTDVGLPLSSSSSRRRAITAMLTTLIVGGIVAIYVTKIARRMPE